MSAPREYKLVTIADLFEQIPVERIDQCLNELAGMIKYHKQINACLSQLAQAQVKTFLADGITWTDDDKREIRVTLKD